MNRAYYYDTKIGRISIVENGDAITHLYFNEIEEKDVMIEETPLLKEAYKQLSEYLDGTRKEFDIPLKPHGTEFQLKVWNALREIPYGVTCSYKDIAIKIDNEKACRAVGLANNRNPISVFIPCHRVIGSNGKLVGYGGGLDIKEKLLNLETEVNHL
ncbi:methylated-DNA--[protein]-cysteine S-methyltransferase [Tissierella sp. Yu-01]|uniref:methylated-DNA--[protein]-cysteine S-methyltransferase n=1 Tax=Tissierella sp. Yu-01 TaxID=3035694 RepID=UPI00240D651A|nr:methylated-DNA--[protein]-cysteine S-methyltransferase [Tissierella sp. Yu-01]WFA09917.1 methylated-DNA--[protein]-cysteine S-methyltransferase [Tissierella sp. Yu-01]